MITAFYAGIFALLHVALSLRVVMFRWKYKVSLGDGGESALQRRIRVQGNFTENVPIALILMLILETQSYYPGIIHVLGLMLLAGRLMHIHGVDKKGRHFIFRRGGAALTFIMIAAAGLLCLSRGLAIF